MKAPRRAARKGASTTATGSAVTPNIDKILKPVDSIVPDDLDRKELQSDLEGAIAFYREGVELRHQPAHKRRKLERALKVTEKLDNDLDLDPRFHPHIVKLEHSLRLALAELDPKLGHRYRRALREVDPERARRLRALAKSSPMLKRRLRGAFRNPLSPWLGYPGVSAFDNLVGGWLADIYKAHFKQEPGFTKRLDPCDTSPDPGYIITKAFTGFVQAVLAEFRVEHNGNPYTRSAIASAFTRGQRGKREPR